MQPNGNADRADPFDALRAWYDADYDACLAATAHQLSSGHAVDGRLLRARVLLRLGRPREALHELHDIAAGDRLSDTSFASRILRGSAYVRLGEIHRGLEILERVECEAECQPLWIRHEVALAVSFAYLALRDFDAALRALDVIDFSAGVFYARACEYRGWIASANAEYDCAVSMFIAALRRLDSCKVSDRFVEANCVQALAFLASERFDRTAWTVVTERRSGDHWAASGLAYWRFLTVMRSAIYAYDVDGEADTGAAYARMAERLAPSDPYKAQALCLRAAIARRAGEPVAQRDHLRASTELLSQTDMASLEGDERLVPLVIAEELSNAGQAAEAHKWFDLYHANRTTSPALAITGDVRRDAYEKLVSAQISEADSDYKGALKAYRGAFDEFRRLGYIRRSVMAALRIVNVTPDDQYLWGHIDTATRAIAETSWIKIEASALRRRAVATRLTAVQREYLRLLCAGKSNPEIARIRNRSVHTVRNQIVPLFDIFNVQSRSELAAECVRSGVLDAAPSIRTTAS